MGGGGGVQLSSKGGLTHTGSAPDGVGGVIGGLEGVETVGVGVGLTALFIDPTARLPTIPPIPPTMRRTMSFSIFV